MENKINISKLLRNCPTGMKLDCTMFENVTFEEVVTEIDCDGNEEVKIVLLTHYNDGMVDEIILTEYGTYTHDETAKCVIFPKGKTTWEGFQKPWTIQDAKDGDIVSYGDGWTCIFKRIHGIWYSSYCFMTSDGEFHTGYEDHEVSTTINGKVHLATNKQRNLLFQKMKEAGYKWNSQTKTLEKLPKFKLGDKIRCKNEIRIIDNVFHNGYTFKGYGYLSFENQDEWELVPIKFDISNLKPFDKVLVRPDNKHKWSIQFFERLNNVLKDAFVCMGGVRYHQCIPYEGNEHLLNTANECDNFFKVWK